MACHCPERSDAEEFAKRLGEIGSNLGLSLSKNDNKEEITVFNCPNCGGNMRHNANNCEWCGSKFIKKECHHEFEKVYEGEQIGVPKWKCRKCLMKKYSM